jgi:hypothetical protein
MSSDYKGFASGKACGGVDQCVIHAEPVSLGDGNSPIVRVLCQRFGRADQSNQLSAERELRGLTTASSLRVSEGVGIAAGLGREATAILSETVSPMQARAAPCLHSHGESVGVSGAVKLGRVAGLCSQIWRTTCGLRPAVRKTTGAWTCAASSRRDDSMSLVNFSHQS